jgi:hypothetical protein
MIGNDEIRDLTEADDASIHEAPDSRDREQGASAGDVNNHDVGASRIDSMSTVCVGDDRSRERDAVDQSWASASWLGERQYGATT